MALLLGVSGRWESCGWSVVQLNHDGEMRPMNGINGTVDAECEVPRTIKRAGLTAFLCLLRLVRPTVAHVDKKGVIGGLRKGEMRCMSPKAKDGDLWILIWEEINKICQEGLQHVKAHRSKKDNQIMLLFAKGLASVFIRIVDLV